MLAFLHTAQAHVATFTALTKELAPEAKVSHRVDELLLADARVQGAESPEIVARVHLAMTNEFERGTSVVVCTCSTIGGIAEAMPTKSGKHAMRIDRAMADEAVRLGPRILVVTALESTLAPTRALIESYAIALKETVRIETMVVGGAWNFFERGELQSYAQSIAAAIKAKDESGDVIVLAQASMAPVAHLLHALPTPILSSPRLGVKAALRLLGSGV